MDKEGRLVYGSQEWRESEQTHNCVAMLILDPDSGFLIQAITVYGFVPIINTVYKVYLDKQTDGSQIQINPDCPVPHFSRTNSMIP